MTRNLPPHALTRACILIYTCADREGRFAVPGLEAGSYRVSVTAPGYVKQEYGQRVFPGQGTVLTTGNQNATANLHAARKLIESEGRRDVLLLGAAAPRTGCSGDNVHLFAVI